MFRPITYAPPGRMSRPVATLSASLARGSPMCQPCSSLPRLPRGSSRLWSGPATKPSSEIDMRHVLSGTAILLSGLRAGVRRMVGADSGGRLSSMIETIARRSGGDGIAAAAQLLHDFNVEYD